MTRIKDLCIRVIRVIRWLTPFGCPVKLIGELQTVDAHFCQRGKFDLYDFKFLRRRWA